MRAAVIGAGPSGLAAAHELLGHGADVDVFERSSDVGGLARSLRLWNQTVDLGAHVLHGGDPEAVALWNAVAGDCHVLPLRRAFWRRGRLLPYPPSALGLLRGLSVRELALGSAGFAAARLRGAARGGDARSWFSARYGDPFYRVLMQSYMQKQWGDDGSGIDASYLDGVIRTVSPQVSVAAHGATRFAYPRAGLSAAWSRLVDRIAERGTVNLDTSVERIIVGSRGVEGLVVDGDERSYNFVIATVALPVLLRMIGFVPAAVDAASAKLRARHMIIVHLLVDSRRSLEHAWIFVDDADVRVGRLSDSRFWHYQPRQSRGVMTLEYWCDSSDDLWTETSSALAARATEELRATSLLPGAVVLEASVTRLASALPVPRLGYLRHRQAVLAFVRSIRGLDTVGRHGSYDVDATLHAMAGGMAAARRVLNARGARPSAPADPARV